MKLGLFCGNGDSIQGSSGASCELVFDSNKHPSQETPHCKSRKFLNL